MGSMGKAAERLAIAQPSVSKAIADLEHIIGVRLLDRTVTGVVPTPYGRALLRRGMGAFDELRQGIKDLEFRTTRRSARSGSDVLRRSRLDCL